MKKLALHIVILMVLATLFSCSTQQLLSSKLEGNISDLITNDSLYEHRIKADDKLSISIWNHDDLSIGSVFSIYNSNESFGKWVLVDQDGYAQLPKIGPMLLAGLTCKEAADTLEKIYSEDIKDPIIVAKVLNRHVTILGEVTMPGYYILEEEQVRIMDVIGKARGFTNYADVSAIKLVRNNISYPIDLQSMDTILYHSLILHSGDIVIVTPKRGKAVDQKAPTLIPFASVLTAVAVFTTLILRQ